MKFSSNLLHFFLVIFLIVPIFTSDQKISGANPSENNFQAPAQVYELIELVNNLREENNLNRLNPHPILMGLAQEQADYNANIGTSTHLDEKGLRPFQRALIAGYPISGDLERGGFFSENIINGPALSPTQVIKMWLGDDLHANTMLSEYRSDLGVGVAVNDGITFYVLETALYSRWPITPPADLRQPVSESASVITHTQPSTPDSDGSSHHVIQNGETLWTIAAAYGLTVEELARRNNLDATRFIQPGKILLINPPGSFPEEPLDAPEPFDKKVLVPTVPLEKLLSPIETDKQVQLNEPSPSQNIESKMPLVSILAIGLALGILVFAFVFGIFRKKTD